MRPHGASLITPLPGWMLRQEQWRLTWLAWLACPSPLYLRRVPRGQADEPVARSHPVSCRFRSYAVGTCALAGRARAHAFRCCDRRRKTRRKRPQGAAERSRPGAIDGGGGGGGRGGTFGARSVRVSFAPTRHRWPCSRYADRQNDSRNLGGGI